MKDEIKGMKLLGFLGGKDLKKQIREAEYRNGILHGRDLNYDNIFVSSKCIVLLFAIHDWMTNKKSEYSRKERFVEAQRPVSFKEIITQLNKNQEDKKIINCARKS